MAELAEADVLGGRYSLKRRLGGGKFGETWQAEDRSLHVPVAVKVFPGVEGQRGDEYMEQARRLSGFWSEPAVVSVFDYFQDAGVFCFVFEYVEGEDLQAYLDRAGRVSLRQALGLLRPVMQTLQKFHKSGIVHAAVSPDNLRFLPNGQMKLLDFGSALSTNGPAVGESSTVRPGYAPPEIVDTSVQRGPWTDVYSLAAIIWQCLTARKPMDCLQRAFEDGIAAPSALGVRIDGSAEATLMRALLLNPQERVQSLPELLDGLEGQKTVAMRPVVADFTTDGLSPVVDATEEVPEGPQPASQLPDYVVDATGSMLDLSQERLSRFERSAYVSGRSRSGGDGGAPSESGQEHVWKRLFHHRK